MTNEIVEAGIPLFAHRRDQEFNPKFIGRLIKYFEGIEMYEYCEELKEVLDTVIMYDEYCECKYPIFDNYSEEDIKCKICNKSISLDDAEE
jgi:hypothetical protein